MSNGLIADYFEKVQDDPGFWTEHVLLELTRLLAIKMKEKNIKRADLARLMGKKRSAITRLLRGEQNTTIRTIVEAAVALGYVPEIVFEQLAEMKAGSAPFAEKRPAFRWSPPAQPCDESECANKNVIPFPSRKAARSLGKIA